MRVTEVWEIEGINWINPRDPEFQRARANREVQEPVGLTPNQMSHKSSDITFQVMHYMSPDAFLNMVDPGFDPGRSKSLDFFEQAVEEGRTFAPLQVWLKFDEYVYWPYVDRAWPYTLHEIKDRLRKGEEVSFEDHRRVVRSHEGRHRAWFSREIGETEVPVTVWVTENR